MVGTGNARKERRVIWDKVVPLKLVQNRIANISIGNSTLRGQGKGAKEVTINFLKNLQLSLLSNISDEDSFKQLLDKFTLELQIKLPNKSFGAARKSLNIFLFEASHNTLLVEHYNLNKIIPYLEMPLDNPTAKKFIEEAKKENVSLKWINIKSLTKEQNEKFQNFAFDLANKRYNCFRCYLDLFYWRND